MNQAKITGEQRLPYEFHQASDPVQATAPTLSVANSKITDQAVLVTYVVAEAIPEISRFWDDFGLQVLPQSMHNFIYTMEGGANKSLSNNQRFLQVFEMWLDTDAEASIEKFFSSFDNIAEYMEETPYLDAPQLTRQEKIKQIQGNQQWLLPESNEPDVTASILNDEIIPVLAPNWKIIGHLLFPQDRTILETIGNDHRNNDEICMSRVFERAREMNKKVTYSVLKKLFECPSINKAGDFQRIPFPARFRTQQLETVNKQASITQPPVSVALASPDISKKEGLPKEVTRPEEKQTTHQNTLAIKENNKIHETSKATFSTQLHNLEKQVKDLKKEKSELEVKVCNLETQLKLKNQQLTRDKETSKTSSSHIEEFKIKIQELQASGTRTTNKAEHSQQESETHYQETIKLQQEPDDIKALLTRKNEQVLTNENEKLRLRTELETEKALRHEKDKIIKCLKYDNELLTAQKEQLKAAEQQLKTELSTQKTPQHENESTQKDKQIEQLRKKNEDLNQQLKSALHRIDILLTDRLPAADKRIKSLSSQIKALEEEKKQLRNQLKEALTKLQTFRAQPHTVLEGHQPLH